MSAKVIKYVEHNVTFSLPVFNQTGQKQNNFYAPENNGEAVAFSFPLLKASQTASSSQTNIEHESNVDAYHTHYIADEEEAKKLLDNARGEVDQIIEVAKARAEEIEREAFERGVAEGHASVSREIDNQVADLRQQLSRTISELMTLHSEITSKAEREMVELSIEMAKKIVQREVTVDREVALTLARVALTRLHSRSTTIIRLHPDDYAHAIAHRERLESDGTVEILEDRSVGLGGCVIQTDMGDVDARIVQQFRELEKGFWGELPY